jgi:endo-1,4-beta-xylanase
MKKHPLPVIFTLAGLLAGAAAGRSGADPLTLKDAFKNDFLIGVAINQSQFSEQDARGVPIIEAQFNSTSPENILKWESVHPKPDQYDFTGPDQYVAFGEKNHMFIIGHCLVWHRQIPDWVFQDTNGQPVTRDVLLQRMHDHISTVVGRYKGRVKGWDVVNEALFESGAMRKSRWETIIGDDYIEKAFQFAHEADPQAQLHYNDYSLEKLPKRNGAIALIKKLKAEGVPITSIGLQCHASMSSPTPEEEDETISAFAALGVRVMITELDVDIVPASRRNQTADLALTAQAAGETNTYVNGLPEEQQQALAKRYADLFRVFVKHRADISRVTFWGVTDGDSWLNARNRKNYPLLFDRDGQPKPAFDAVIQEATPH